MTSVVPETEKKDMLKCKGHVATTRLGGKGTARRKKKIVHRNAVVDDRKLQSTLKKISVNPIPGVEEVNMIKSDGSVIHFNNPKMQASLTANTFCITGPGETKHISDLMPGILNHIGTGCLLPLDESANKSSAANVKATVDSDDELPELVGNFDETQEIKEKP